MSVRRPPRSEIWVRLSGYSSAVASLCCTDAMPAARHPTARLSSAGYRAAVAARPSGPRRTQAPQRAAHSSALTEVNAKARQKAKKVKGQGQDPGNQSINPALGQCICAGHEGGRMVPSPARGSTAYRPCRPASPAAAVGQSRAQPALAGPEAPRGRHRKSAATSMRPRSRGVLTPRAPVTKMKGVLGPRPTWTCAGATLANRSTADAGIRHCIGGAARCRGPAQPECGAVRPSEMCLHSVVAEDERRHRACQLV
jgi:hypothetical protein